MNVRPSQRSCRDGPLVPPSTPPPRSLPAMSPPHLSAPHSCAPHMRLPLQQAGPCDPPSRWVSMAVSPALYMLLGPCSLATVPANTPAALQPFLRLPNPPTGDSHMRSILALARLKIYPSHFYLR